MNLNELIYEPLVKQLGQLFVDGLRDMIEGSEEDLREYGLRVGKLLVAAIAKRNTDLQSESRAQFLMLLEKNRLRVAKKQQRAFQKAMDMVLRIAIKVGAAFVGEALIGAGLQGEGTDLLDKLFKGE
jgi:hypothetical protein